MRKALALFLASLLALQPAFAGLNKHMSRFAGGTISTLPLDATGFIDTEPETHFKFSWAAGKNKQVGRYPEGNIQVPYSSVTKLIYGDTKHLRIGETIALTALAGVGGLLLLLSKSHTHYVTVDYKDEADHEQLINFEVGKDAARPLMDSLELRTGKKFLLEAALDPKKKDDKH